MATQETYPVQMDLNAPLEIARWRVIQGILAIPHFFVILVLGIVYNVLTFVSVFTVIFTGNVPRGIFDFRVAFLRYVWRVQSYYLFMREEYPPFDWTSASEDPGGDPAWLSIAYPEKMSRILWLVKGILAIPHIIVIILMVISMYVVIPISFLVVLFTGKWPEGLRKYVIGFARWITRVQAYTGFMTDVYPPFSLEP